MLRGWGRSSRGRAVPKSTSDRVDLERQVQLFSDVIEDMKTRQTKPGHCQRIADYEQIVVDLREALAAIQLSRIH